MRQKSKRSVMHRLTAMVMSLCIVLSMLGNTGLLVVTAHAAGQTVGPTEHILTNSRKADPDTMDSYIGKLLSNENGSRYAGRVWTDKTVFAYGADAKEGGVTGN